jgi:hypothetical protein
MRYTGTMETLKEIAGIVLTTALTVTAGYWMLAL